MYKQMSKSIFITDGIAFCPCPPGFRYPPNGQCYLFIQHSFVTWKEAQGYCQSLHPKGNLAIIESEMENTFVKDLTFGSRYLRAKTFQIVNQDDFLFYIIYNVSFNNLLLKY